MLYFPKKIEEKWRKRWLKKRVYEPDIRRAKKPYYNLMMFPYPSAEGLHIGSVRTFSGIDIYGRFKRMQGYDVFEPIGLDGFGIHSENYALKVGKHPFEHARDSEKNFYRQLSIIGNGFSWEEKLETYDPDYYKWTQWIFTQMFKHGLAYRKKAAVNWCPSCKTVLADEQVLQGECERCQSKVVKKDLEQWFFKITDYADRLLKNLEKIDWPEPIKIAQRNWIGKSEGALIKFPLKQKYNYVFLHAYKGSPGEDFWPWLKKELQEKGHKIYAPQLPNPSDPNIEEQVEFVLKNHKLNKDTIIVTHSLGGVVAMKLLPKLKSRIFGVVMIAPPLRTEFLDGKRRPTLEKATDWKFDFPSIREKAGWISVVKDISDDIVPANHPEEIAWKLNAKLVEVNACKPHFNSPEEPAILSETTPDIQVFTTRPDTLFGVTYMILGPEHPLLQNLESRIQNLDEVREYIKSAKAKTDEERIAEGKGKTGVELKGIKVINPATKEEIPVWIADYVLGNVGTGAIMAVPAHDKRDWEFAKRYGLPIKEVVRPTYGNEKDSYEYRRTISAVVRRKSDGRFLALKWKKYDWITAPIGGIDKGETPMQAAEREVFEETGFKAKAIQLLGGEIESHYFAEHKNEWRKRLDQPVFLEMIDEKPVEISQEEKEKHDIIWLSPEEVVQKIMYDNNKLSYERYLQKNYAFVGEGKTINSNFLDSLPTPEAKKKIVEWLEKNNFGKKTITFRLRDWLISRQRYWGPPIPVIYCDKCPEIQNILRYGVDYTKFDGRKFMIYVVPEKDLPVKLPRIKNYRPTGTGVAPLASEPSFYKVKCPKCGSSARRETDVSDTFLDSAWYYLGYLMAFGNWKLGFGNSAFAKLTRRWLPVDSYIGGAEHAVLHLLYVRFLAIALQDIGVLHFSVKGGKEPFKQFRTHGMITKDGAKMSKSKGNVVNPDQYINAYGSDAVRMYLAFLAPLDQGGDFRDTGIKGITRFLERVWRFYQQYKRIKRATPIYEFHSSDSNNSSALEYLSRTVQRTVKKVTEDIESLQYNTAISALMILLNEFEKNHEAVTRKDMEVFLKLLAPFAPHMAEELYYRIKNQELRIKGKKYRSIHLEPWPKYDPKLIQEETFELIVQVNGKVRGKVIMPIGTSEEEAKKAALAETSVRQHVSGEPRKVIFVPDKLINFVI